MKIEPQTTVKLSISRKSETNEWLVKVYVNGRYSENQTYYTDDKQDAIDTASAMATRYEAQGAIVIKK